MVKWDDSQVDSSGRTTNFPEVLAGAPSAPERRLCVGSGHLATEDPIQANIHVIKLGRGVRHAPG